jgi:hypothetical protein
LIDEETLDYRLAVNFDNFGSECLDSSSFLFDRYEGLAGEARLGNEEESIGW